MNEIRIKMHVENGQLHVLLLGASSYSEFTLARPEDADALAENFRQAAEQWRAAIVEHERQARVTPPPA